MQKIKKNHKIYLGLPFHSNSANNNHNNKCNNSNNPDIVAGTIDNFETVLVEQIVERVAKPDGVHGGRDGVREGKNDAHRGAKFRPERSRDDEVDAPCKNFPLQLNRIGDSSVLEISHFLMRSLGNGAINS